MQPHLESGGLKVSNITRRTALAASATLPLLPATALDAETSADAELLRLGAELDRAWVREKALICDDGKCGDGYEAANDARRP